MAKITFTKLGLKLNTEEKVFLFNDQEIEVKQYLPVNDKMDLISTVLNATLEDEKFYNVGKIDVYFALELVYRYTNITFTDKQKENITKLYDTIVSSGFYNEFLKYVPVEEVEYIKKTMMDTVQSIYAYNNSALGFLDTLHEDYSDLDMDATALNEKMQNPENLELLKQIVTKLG